jgi:hypothetical protein
MKQGQASRSGMAGAKREPNAHAISEEAVDQLGQACSYKHYDLYKGRGYEAPKGGKQTHPCGSQGKH